ncbi:MAG: isoleucine--tRNA ligase, partial [Gemmatimonadetes bacterium]|nr:isoleucine--tRNA ligase [Gemmatimonadota bacterium]
MLGRRGKPQRKKNALSHEETGRGLFEPVPAKVDFVALESRLLKWWRDAGIVEQYLKRNEAARKRLSFIDGPITANNPMGVHHAWGRTYKDLFLRWRTMQGYRQRYQNGFDGQGLWVEVEVERELGFRSKRDIEAYGIDRFVEACKERVRRCAAVQTEQSKRLGYWMDWDSSYFTTSDENNYTIWHFLKVCHERGWLYEGRDVMPWCPRCGTGLSQHEIVTEGYQTLVHPGVFLRFPLIDRPGESLLVWTTTPWTLTSNVVAAVHPEQTYVKVRDTGGILYLGKALVPTLVRDGVLSGEHQVLEEVPGVGLAGLRYRGPFDELPAQKGVEHRVVLWEEVGEDEGTGVVHVAPGAGAEDFALGRNLGLPAIAPLDEDGNFVRGFDWLEGKNVSEVNEDIFRNLREKGLLVRVNDYAHRYPVCWRCDTELVFRLVDEWFISMDELRHEMAEVAGRITWVPAFGLERELDWLRNMHDWMISKKRYWGLALPIYKCACGNVDVMGSETELRERAVEGWERFEGHSPHRPWVDAVKIACSKCGRAVPRIRDVGNPWLDAGIVPFSTLGYRHGAKTWKEWFPADWISESFPGQFRNWFYSLLAMSTVLEKREPFKAVFTYALVRDERGEEMHKSKGNAIPFDEAAERMGVDVMRWMYARQNPANNLNFGYRAGDEVRRRFLLTLWNVYSFFVTYANLDGYDPRAPREYVLSDLDRWLRTELCQLVERATEYLETWRPMEAMYAVEEFIDRLSNWYVRRSRRRFWKSENDSDKLAAYTTLYFALTTLCRLLAPVAPFLADEMYRNLVARL